MKDRIKLIKMCQDKLLYLKHSYQYAFSENVDDSLFKERVQNILPEIKNALKRIERGDYGLCEITGEEIEPKRLLAVPWTRVSMLALEELEAS